MSRLIGTKVISRCASTGEAIQCHRMLQLTGAVLLACAMTGCSISNSISDSISSPFKWSSQSSKSSGEKESYQGDVRDYTEAYLRSSSDLQGFRRGVASLAQKHGITNWEADQASYTGIGEGLGKARVKQAQLEVYKTNLSGGDAVKASAIQKGYEQYLKEQ
jgi:hypothetical protein